MGRKKKVEKLSEKVILFRLSYEEFRYIKEFCSAKGLTVSAFIRDVLKKHIREVRSKEEKQRKSYYERFLPKTPSCDVIEFVEKLEKGNK